MIKSNWRISLLSMLAVVLLALTTGSIFAAEDNAPVYIEFAKADPDGNFIWNGAVSGDVNGDLETVLLEARQSGWILHVVFDWIVDGDCSFTARLNGILDTQSGRVLMNGRVIEGCWQGAQVHEEGQLVNPADSGFEGVIRIMPGSAG